MSRLAPLLVLLVALDDVPVALTAADFFAGRDPVLARALR
jgi:hypothetical protein